jgi:hypothetical protein
VRVAEIYQSLQGEDVPEVICRWADEYEYPFQFVVQHPRDGEELLHCLAGFPRVDRQQVMRMPMGTDMDE